MIMVKQLYAKWTLLIVIDLVKANYQTMLIAYLEFTIKNSNHAWKEQKSN